MPQVTDPEALGCTKEQLFPQKEIFSEKLKEG